MSELEKHHTETPRDETEFTLLDDDTKIMDSFIKADYLFQDKTLLGSGGSAAAAPITTKSGYREGAPIDDAGSTAITVFIKRNNRTKKTEIICANTGDSRAVLYLGRSKSADVRTTVEPLSYDHKPTNAEERMRIKTSGGYVEFGRVNGTLAVSRAFGDLGYKTNTQIDARKQAVTALPDIKRVKFDATHDSIDANGEFDFLVLACDGVWDVMTNDAVCEFVLQKIRQQKSGEYWRLREQSPQQHDGGVRVKEGSFDLGIICEDILDHCVRKLDSKDNVSAALVLFS